MSETIITANCEQRGEALRKGKILYYLNIVLTWFIAAVLLFAGVSKIIVPEVLIENLSAVFNFLPETVVIMVSTLLPIIEIGLGILLLAGLYNEKMKNKKKLIQILTVIIFGIFLLYSIYGFVIGSGSDCGCFGNAVTTNFGWGMIVRNLIFFGIAVFILRS